jgi:hypothetical protein
MHDNAFAAKRFTRQQGVKQTKQALYQFSDFWKQKTHRNAAKRAGKTINHLQVVE